MRKFINPLGTLCLVACSGCMETGPTTEMDVDQAFGPSVAEQSLRDLAESGFDVSVSKICGPALGRGVEMSQSAELDWFDDGIRDGRVAFVFHDNDNPDVIFRDAAGRWISAITDTGSVTVVFENDRSGEQVWSVIYHYTGVTETHNIIKNNDGFVDLWTSNKPNVFGASSPYAGSAKIFTSNCVRP